MSAIRKAFPGVLALDGAGLDIRAGEIHGLVGENGAGKSTIIKILSGIYGRDEGAIAIDGETVADASPAAMQGRGVRVIHQEMNLVEHFTVAESVFLGQERTGWFGLSRRRMRTEAEKFLRDVLACELDGDALIRELGMGERKLVQIAAALIDGKARLVVLDEPTAPLAAAETDHLFSVIRNLRQRGISILYVSHYIGEIVEICDRVTVFRNGRNVATLPEVAASDASRIIALMIGRELSDLFPQRRNTPGELLLAAEGLGDGRHFFDISFGVRAGEIFGIAGLIGSGREELVDVLYGLRAPASGRVLKDGTARHGGPAQAVESGLVLVPRDRRRDGLVLDFDVAGNINLASLKDVSTLGFRRGRKASVRAAGLAEKLDIRPRATGTLVRLLSGGNQQKVVLGRWLAARARIFLLDEPTAGVDIGARAEIYRLVADLASRGAAIIVSSSDTNELHGLCDRIAVLVRGRLEGIVAPADLGEEELVALTTSAGEARPAP